jgi:hypothetical protein
MSAFTFLSYFPVNESSSFAKASVSGCYFNISSIKSVMPYLLMQKIYESYLFALLIASWFT